MLILLFAFQVCWQAPTENVDGTPITRLTHFDIYYGAERNTYTRQIRAGANSTCANVRAAEGVYYVAMTATDQDGDQSAYSNEVRKIESRLSGPGGGSVLQGPTGGQVITGDDNG